MSNVCCLRKLSLSHSLFYESRAYKLLDLDISFAVCGAVYVNMHQHIHISYMSLWCLYRINSFIGLYYGYCLNISELLNGFIVRI